MKKSLLVFLIVITCCFAITGCKKEERRKKEGEESIVGGLDIEITEEQATIEKEALDAFERAAKKENKKYRAVALLGKQTVSGTNYMFLAVEEDKEYKMITVYSNLQNDSEFIYNNPIDFTKYVNNNISYNNAKAVGNWHTDLPEKGEELGVEVKLAFENAVKKIEDATYYPITVVGRQLTSGTNYAVLCIGNANDNAGAYILTLYVDLNDKQEITSSAYIDLTEYAK